MGAAAGRDASCWRSDAAGSGSIAYSHTHTHTATVSFRGLRRARKSKTTDRNKTRSPSRIFCQSSPPLGSIVPSAYEHQLVCECRQHPSLRRAEAIPHHFVDGRAERKDVAGLEVGAAAFQQVAAEIPIVALRDLHAAVHVRDGTEIPELEETQDGQIF